MQLFNPLLYGQLTTTEAAQNNAPYTRNGKNEALREYVKTKFGIATDDFHFEEGEKDMINVIANGTTIVNTEGKTWA